MAKVELDIEISSSGDVTGIKRSEDALKNGEKAAASYETRLEEAREAQEKLAAGAAVMGAALLAALGGAIAVAGEYADEIAKASARTGIAAEELSALRYAAEQSDVSFQQLNTGLARMSRTMTETSWGTGMAAQAYDELGVKVTDASGKLRGTKEVFVDVAEGIANIEDPAKRTALAMMIFGRGGVQLMPMMMDGAKGVEYLTERAEQLGLVISGETAAAAERFNDAMADVKHASKAVAMAIGETAFGTAEFSERLAESIGAIANWIREHETAVKVLASLGATLAGLVTTVYTANKAFGLAKETIGTVRTVIAWYTAKVTANTTAITTETAALGANTAAQTANAAAARSAGAARGMGAAGAAAGAARGAGAVGGAAAGGTAAAGLSAAAVPALVVVAAAVAAYLWKRNIDVGMEAKRENKKAIEGMGDVAEKLGRERVKTKREAREEAERPITPEEARRALDAMGETPRQQAQREQREAAAATAAVQAAAAAPTVAAPGLAAVAAGIDAQPVQIDPTMMQIEVILRGDGPLMERIARSSEVRASIHNATVSRQRMAFGEA